MPPIVLFVAGLFRLARRNGARPWTLWSAVISLLAAPIERDLAQRENQALRADNDRLTNENQRLRGGGRRSTDGSSGNADGTPTSPSPPSTPNETQGPFTK